jgi:hypothetical protein
MSVPRAPQPQQPTRKLDCPVCSKPLRGRQSELDRHLRIHTGGPFVCATCKRGFTQKAALAGHVRIHTGEMPYARDECKRLFRYLCNLRRHKANVHTHAAAVYQPAAARPDPRTAFAAGAIDVCTLPSLHSSEPHAIAGACVSVSIGDTHAAPVSLPPLWTSADYAVAGLQPSTPVIEFHPGGHEGLLPNDDEFDLV